MGFKRPRLRSGGAFRGYQALVPANTSFLVFHVISSATNLRRRTAKVSGVKPSAVPLCVLSSHVEIDTIIP